MEITPTLPRVWIQTEYNRRRNKNPTYSLRAFARSLRVPPGRLSEILSSKRSISLELGKLLADRLGFDPITSAKFTDCIIQEKQSRRKSSQKGSLADDVVGPTYQQLSLDSFHIIADWYHFAILSLIETRSFRYDYPWIARRLGISVVEARTAVERLLRLDLIEETSGTLRRTTANLSTPPEVKSPALRRAHQQVLEKAMNSLEEDALSERDISSITMAIDPAKIPIAKEMICKFRRKLCAFLESEKKEEVYYLNIQMFSATKAVKKEIRK